MPEFSILYRIPAVDTVAFYIKVFIFGSLALCLMWFIIRKIDQGKNWARIIAFIIATCNCISIVLQFFTPMSFFFVLFELSPLGTLISSGGNVLCLISTFLLFRSPSSEWFRQMKEHASQMKEYALREKHKEHARHSAPVQAKAMIHDLPQEKSHGTDTAAIKYLSDLAEYGDVEAQFELGLMFAEGRGVSRDDTQAVQWLRNAAERGNAKAQYNLGLMYAEGRGVAKDDKSAVQWYQKAAEQGHAQAQYNLGKMYQEGRGVGAKNYESAVAWFRDAATRGYAEAQYELGLSYATGRGVAKNQAEAVEWYQKAAEQGHAAAQYALTRCDSDLPPSKDDVQSVQEYREAAEQGDAEAQYNLGRMYEDGRGVPIDETHAVQWYRKAAEQGDENAKRALKRFK